MLSIRQLAFLICLAIAPRVEAAELWMFEEDGCAWCERWMAELGPIYPKTAEGQIAPLRQLDIHEPLPEPVVLASKPRFTPTFVLVHQGREIGRIEGHPGEDFFWGLLELLIKQLPEQEDTDL